MARAINRFDVFWIDLNPTRGAEIRKTRPGVVLSPDVMNRALKTVIIAPLTSTKRRYPTRVPARVMGVEGEIALDQLRAVDRERLGDFAARLDARTADEAISTLLTMFA